MSEDAGYKALKDYSADLEAYIHEGIIDGLTESDTRAKFIDVFLCKCLGWDESCIRREKTYWDDEQKAAIDYVLSSIQPLLVVEAKKSGKLFELPDVGRRLLYSLGGTIQSCPIIWGAIQQARAYCDCVGAPYALVTNGRQFGLFRAITTGINWKKGNVAVFDVPSLLARHFHHVHWCLSPERICGSGLESLLKFGETAGKVNGGRIGDQATYQAGRLCNKMTDVVEQAFAGALRDQPEPTDEFLLECYSLDEPTKYYANSLESLLRDPLPPFAPEAGKVRPGSEKDPFGKAVTASIPRRDLRPPTLLIGGAGTGKTTFLQWFFRVNEHRPNLENTVLIWVDFRKAGYAADEVAQRLRQEIISQLEDSPLLGLDSLGALQAVYRDRVNRLRKTTLAPFEQDASQMQTKIAECINQWQSDACEYIRRLLHYAIPHSGRSVLIVLDNADQKDEPFQYAVYDVAQQLANSEPVSIVLVLRESTFFKASQSPRLNAFSQQQVFHIQAPRLAPVLSKRFSYLASCTRKQPFTITSAAGYPLTVDDVSRFLTLLEKSILEGTESPRILELLEAVSNGSVREALNLVYEFLVSGHTKMDGYFWGYTKDETSRIPYHEFLASVMLDEMAFFSENDSHTFVNLFARQPGPGDSHFSRLRILTMAKDLSPGNTLRPEDYVPLGTIKEPFLQCGMAEATVNRHLKSLVRFGLLIADTQARDEKQFEGVKSVHLAAAGRYYLDRLSGEFQYCARVIPDTFIVDEIVYSQLYDLYRPVVSKNFLLSLDRRLQTTEIFVRYMVSQEQAEHETGAIARSLQLGDLWFAERCAHPVLAEIERIKKLLATTGREKGG